MTCLVTLVVDGVDQLAVSATLRRAGEVVWATVRIRIVGRPVEVSVETVNTPALIRGLLQAAQQLCHKAVVSGVVLPGGGWERAASLLNDALVALAGTEHSDG
jgi:hypothetical protein